MALNIAQIITGTVTEGGSDAYAEASVVTALAGIQNVAYRVLGVLFEMTSAAYTTPAANAAFEVCLSRRTKAAMPLVSDLDVIIKWHVKQAVATSGGVVVPMLYSWIPQGDVIVVEDPLFLQIDSTAFSASLSARCRIEYELVKISEVDRLSLLARSLT